MSRVPAHRRPPRFRPRKSLLAMVAMAPALAACAATTTAPTPTAVPNVAASPSSAAASPSPADSRPPATAEPSPVEPPPPSFAAVGPLPQDLVPEPPKPKPKPVLDPERLVGLNRLQVAELLGPPDFKRRDAPAEIWQYRNQVCTLDLFLYEASPDGTYTVAHVEVRGEGAVDGAREGCLPEPKKPLRPAG